MNKIRLIGLGLLQFSVLMLPAVYCYGFTLYTLYSMELYCNYILLQAPLDDISVNDGLSHLTKDWWRMTQLFISIFTIILIFFSAQMLVTFCLLPSLLTTVSPILATFLAGYTLFLGYNLLLSYSDETAHYQQSAITPLFLSIAFSILGYAASISTGFILGMNYTLSLAILFYFSYHYLPIDPSLTELKWENVPTFVGLLSIFYHISTTILCLITLPSPFLTIVASTLQAPIAILASVTTPLKFADNTALLDAKIN